MANQSERGKLKRELVRHLREKDKAALGLLRARISAARVERRHMVNVARTSCRTALVSLRERQAAERVRLREAHHSERDTGRTVCLTGKKNAKATGLELEAKAKKTLKDERIFQSRIQRAGKSKPERSTARERRQEDDDAVRSNLPPELVPVFNAHRKHIKGSERRSRTEAFLEWAEENPGEVLEAQQSEADRGLRELLKTQAEFSRSVRSARRYKQSPEELRELLAAVPF